MDSHVNICAQKWENSAEIFFTKNAQVIPKNCVKIACCGKPCTDLQMCENCAAQLHRFLVGLLGS